MTFGPPKVSLLLRAGNDPAQIDTSSVGNG